MATTKKTSKKASKKKAVKRKTGADRNATPKLTTCPYVANLTRPHTTESSGKLARKAVDVMVAKESWRADVRQAFADGTDLPEFPVSKFANPNTGQLSRAAFEKLNDAARPGTMGEADSGLSGLLSSVPRLSYAGISRRWTFAGSAQGHRRGS